MDFFSIFLIGTGLAMDCFAVSITSGVILKYFRFKEAFKIAFFFGLFQGIMPVFGWLAGIGFINVIADYDHWVAFILLLFLGGKMIYEDFKSKSDDDEKFNPLLLPVLISLSVATSIDALAVGITFAFLQSSITIAVIQIGVITFCFSVLGLYFGVKFGKRYNIRAEIIGGIILISIGFKILISHLFF